MTSAVPFMNIPVYEGEPAHPELSSGKVLVYEGAEFHGIYSEIELELGRGSPHSPLDPYRTQIVSL